MTTAPLPKRVFITGAQGFIGQQLMRRYRDLGCDVRGMDLQGNPEQGIVAADLCQPKQWAHHVEGCELFIHTAAVVSLSASWADYRRITVDGVRHALANAQRAGCRRFVHFSSILAMGYDYVDGADEQAPVVIGKDCRYGVAKGASEHLVLAAHASGNIDCCIIRPGDVYGPGSRAWLLEPLKMARSGRLLLPNGGRGIFTPIYIDDLIDGTLLAAHSEAASGQIFILWGEQAVSCGEFFSYHWRWAGRRGRPPSLPLQAAIPLTKAIHTLNRWRGVRDEACPDTMRMFNRKGAFNGRKARGLLGFEPKISLAEGMEYSAQWLREIGER
ncbi:MAG: NAD-dependent epimerase/dehydratase family protein [Spongiibacter marinus]|uniref:NAD-dependent epimerase/dehydratase family protein n=1 Tax=Spongiibacter TaxID=630749 RepID=UPI000C09BCB2|nr:NAD(P)-dependent oxidoreductase [Spongiibacter sp.]MAK43374.1 oxidoreductase [Spongiibacter sp.]